MILKWIRSHAHFIYAYLVVMFFVLLYELLLFQRAQTEAVTFLGNQESSRSLYAIPGLDYVAHDDIIPYTSVERVPLQHELFDKFLMHNADKGNNNAKLNPILASYAYFQVKKKQ